MSATVANSKPSVRKDPSKRRRLGGASAWKVKCSNPDKKHVWVFENSDFGVDYYESAGYDVEKVGGECSTVGRTAEPGDVIRRNGHVLMSIDKEDHADIVQNGMDGDSGESRFDVIEKLIHNKDGGIDDLRSKVAKFVNESGPTRRVVGMEG